MSERWPEESCLFYLVDFLQIFLLSTQLFFDSAWSEYFPELFNLSLAPSAMIGWPPQYSPPAFREPVRTQPKMMLQGQTLFHPEVLFNISETKLAAFGFQFQLPLHSVLTIFFIQSQKLIRLMQCFLYRRDS